MVALKSGAQFRLAGGCRVLPDGLLNIVITQGILTVFASVCPQRAGVPSVAIVHGFHQNPHLAECRV